MSRIDDAAFVREQYASEANLAARKSVYATAEGPDARELTFEAVAEVSPRRVLEVGGGEGELASRIKNELGGQVVGIDQSARMVEVQCAQGIDARVGDVQSLPFRDGEFDCAVAAWMLYHVPQLDRALGELARVLRPGGRLVATANAFDHLAELYDLLGRDRAYRRRVFGRENGGAALARHFSHIERRDADGWVTMDEEAIDRYVTSWPEFGRTPALDLAEPLRVRRVSSVFVAQKAA